MESEEKDIEMKEVEIKEEPEECEAKLDSSECEMEVKSEDEKKEIDENEAKDDENISDETETKVTDTNSNTNDGAAVESETHSENTSDAPPPPQPRPRGRPGRKKKIYNDDDDPATIKEKRKKRALELKLRSLKCSLNEATEVSGKRQKKAPQRFELQPVEKRKSSVDDGKGRGELFGNIRWISHQLRAASLTNLRLLHRLIYRKQGMFAEKHIIKNVMKFNGFPFDASHPELKRRREHLEKLPDSSLQQISYMLGLRPGSHEEMIDRIINFLLCPSQKAIEAYITEVMDAKLQSATSKSSAQKIMEFSFCQKSESPPYMPFHTNQKTDSSPYLPIHGNQKLDSSPFMSFLNQKSDSSPYMPVHASQLEDHEQPIFPEFPSQAAKIDLSAPWKKPEFFTEGNGVKLKYIRAVIANIGVASDAFIELLHRLLFLNVDEKPNMRRNILEFSGLNCDIGTPNYIYRVRILSVLPMEQLKLICRVLCLPTWHRSRQFLTDGIMDFLAVPRISAMKKRVPPVFSEEISFSFDNKVNQLKSVESEEIEIVPDIHIPDEPSSPLGCDYHMENEYLGVKLKNFSNIHYQVISTPAAKLTDVHMILYLTTSAQNNIRKNILEFSGFPFEEHSNEYQCRRTLMEQMGVEDLKTVATVLCVSQYICDNSKKSLIDAILKFLLKPSALLSSSTMMPTITHAPASRTSPPVVIKKATSTSLSPKLPKHVEVKPEIIISTVGTSGDSKDTSVKAIIDAISTSGAKEPETKLEIEKVKACLSNSAIEITPLPPPNPPEESPTKIIQPAKIAQPVQTPKVSPHQVTAKPEVKEVNGSEADEQLSCLKKEVSNVAPRVQYFESDDEDDQPLSKMVGHPNDDQLRALVSKIIKESKLQDITMKHVIRKVFEAYPNYDLNYRKEFIKSNVRLILSQMDDQSCSVSTTVINI